LNLGLGLYLLNLYISRGCDNNIQYIYIYIHTYIYTSIYIYIHINIYRISLYLDAEVLVLPPVFLPQDSVFSGCRSSSSSVAIPLLNSNRSPAVPLLGSRPARIFHRSFVLPSHRPFFTHLSRFLSTDQLAVGRIKCPRAWPVRDHSDPLVCFTLQLAPSRLAGLGFAVSRSLSPSPDWVWVSPHFSYLPLDRDSAAGVSIFTLLRPCL